MKSQQNRIKLVTRPVFYVAGSKNTAMLQKITLCQISVVLEDTKRIGKSGYSGLEFANLVNGTTNVSETANSLCV